MKPWRALVAALLLAALALGAWAQPEQPVPALSARVIDQTGTLSTAQRAALETKLADFEAKSGPQIVVLLVATTAPEDIASYAQRVADQWKIGRRAVGDGVVLLVAKDERKVRIEVAKALEGAIPDLAARQIIDQQIKPAFRADDYAGGLNRAVDALIARINGEGLPAPPPPQRRGDTGGGGVGIDQLGLFFFIVVPIVGTLLTRVFGRRFGSLLTSGAAGGLAWWFTASIALALGAGVAALVIVGLLGIGSALRPTLGGRGRGGPWIGGGGFGGGGFGGGGFGGGGGGGFSSGGGGDFGGGGASGDW
ncbi:MAG: TPM domain-containing protein [Proteobacteria bacterium]|nr:TPM domain-containing protein [Pseudomonadota bacterium]